MPKTNRFKEVKNKISWTRVLIDSKAEAKHVVPCAINEINEFYISIWYREFRFLNFLCVVATLASPPSASSFPNLFSVTQSSTISVHQIICPMQDPILSDD